jgi:hypothetical protein
MTPTDKAANFGLSFSLALLEGLAKGNPWTSKRRRKLMTAHDAIMEALIDYPEPDPDVCCQAVEVFEALDQLVNNLSDPKPLALVSAP